jgi:hypothetical protein
MKIRWYSLFFLSFAPHFQIKLSTHGSNFNSIFVIMIELEFIFLTQNFNTMDLVKFLRIYFFNSHLDHSSHIEDDIMQNQEQKRKVKKVKNQDSMGKSNFFFSTMPFSLWAVLAIWLHVGKNELKTHFK